MVGLDYLVEVIHSADSLVQSKTICARLAFETIRSFLSTALVLEINALTHLGEQYHRCDDEEQFTHF
jgi:hypothetical protein